MQTTCSHCHADVPKQATYCPSCGAQLDKPASSKSFSSSRGPYPSLELLIGILILPYFFVWFTFRRGYEPWVRAASVAWLILYIHLIHQVHFGAS